MKEKITRLGRVVRVYNCVPCGHEWTARNLKLDEAGSVPKACPRCRRKNYNAPAAPKVNKLGQPRLPRRKYHFHELEIGEQYIEPWEWSTPERPFLRQQRAQSLGSSICAHQRYTGKRFHTYAETDGLRIKRVE